MRAITTVITLAVSIGLLTESALAVAEQSQDTVWEGEGLALRVDLPYGDDPDQVLHVYKLERRGSPRPAVVHFQGGGLVEGEPLEGTE